MRSRRSASTPARILAPRWPRQAGTVWLGLVPELVSTGDRTKLGKISKRGNKYLRTLIV
jgi:transposase